MIELTTEEKVFLIECYYSRGKIYDEAFRDFRAEYGRSRVQSEAALQRVIDHFKEHGTVEDRRDNLQRSIELTTEEKVFLVECYFSRGQIYDEAFRDFRAEYGRSRVTEAALQRVIDNFKEHGTVEDHRENLQRLTLHSSAELTTEEKVFLVECYYSRGKLYDLAFRDFYRKYRRSRVNENALQRVIDNFKRHGTVEDRRDNLQRSIELTTEEKVFLVECYYSRGQIYNEAFKDFRAEYGRSRVTEAALQRVIDNFKEHGTVEDHRENLQRLTLHSSAELTTEEKVFLVECYYSRGKFYDEAFRDFRAEYGRIRVQSEAALQRVIDNFKEHGTVEDHRENLQHPSPDPSVELTTEEKVFLVECYYSREKNSSNVFCGFHRRYGRGRAENNHVLMRVIDNFKRHGTVEDRRENLQRP